MAALVLVSGIAAAAYWPFQRAAGPTALQAAVEINRTSGPHPLPVSVAASVSGGTPPYQYSWSFGDGGTASVAGATHVYDTRGTYQVVLRVTDHANRTTAAGAVVTVTAVEENLTLLNASFQTLGAGETKAWIVPISIPSTADSTWLFGSTNVTGCSLGGNCLAFVEVLNVHDETNLTQGNAITDPIWCLVENGSCQSNRTMSLDVNLGRVAGETVYLVLFNTDLLWSQTVNAHVWLDWSY